MMSFNIISLFTCVLLSRKIELILDKTYEPSCTCLFSKIKREECCSICQMEEITMGSPLGPLFTNISISYFESKLKRTLEENGAVYSKPFVDDSLYLLMKILISTSY